MQQAAQETTLDVANVVADSEVGVELDLDVVADDLAGAQYNPSDFPGIVYRQQSPKSTVLLFRSGAVVCTGTQNIGDAQKSILNAKDKLSEIGVPISSDIDIQIQNIVLNGDLDVSINLNAAAIGLGLEQTEYEPEQFPGLIYRISKTDTVVLVFGSGKVVVTGVTDLAVGRESLQILERELSEIGLIDQ
jgi:transcription initiation factor TFIID TATA-box-binding protein